MLTETFLIENYLRADESFHYARKQLATRWPTRAHNHDYFEVFLIVDGQTEHWINGTSQMLEPGQLMFVRPSDTHAFKADRKTGCEIINIMFRMDTAQHLETRYADTVAGRFFASTAPLPEVHSLGPVRFERAMNVSLQLQTADRSLAKIEEYLLVLVNRVAVPQVGVVDTAPRWFSAACNAAQNRDVFRKGAAGFIEAAGRSHEHVCRITRDVLGMTPTEYVNGIRIEHAAHLLRSEDTSIDTIAETCGFENTSYFYRLFQRRFAMTPRQYRAALARNPFET